MNFGSCRTGWDSVYYSRNPQTRFCPKKRKVYGLNMAKRILRSAKRSPLKRLFRLLYRLLVAVSAVIVTLYVAYHFISEQPTTAQNGTELPVANGAYAKMGDPDMVVCYKGMFIAIEGKTYEGRQSDWQRLRMEQVQKAGGIYAIIRSVDGARQLVEELDRRHPDEDEG